MFETLQVIWSKVISTSVLLCIFYQWKFLQLTKKLYDVSSFRSSRPEVILGKGVLKICSKFTGEQPCRSAISIKFQSSCNFDDVARRHGCSLVNLLRIFRTPFPRNTSGWLFLHSVNVILENRKRFSGFSQINWLVPIWWET